VDSSSDEQMMSARPSLLGGTVVMDIFWPSVLSYHCSDALVAMNRLPVVTVTYGQLVRELRRRTMSVPGGEDALHDEHI
jgi:hypothetical protein